MNNTNRTRGTFLRRAGILALLVAMWGFAASDRTPASLSSAAHAAQSDARQKPSDKSDHDLSALKIFNRVVILIKDNYVDPKRVEPRKMLINALDQVEMRVAEIMVEGDEKSPTLKVTVNKVSKEFKVTEVDSLWRMSFALKEVFDFINKNLRERDETREIEYAAVNGMLRTLDPHSVLLSPEYFKEMKLQTKGEFGGLGFVIQMKEGNLTVVKVLKGTPAHKGGIKNKDQILQINHESTINMDLNEAVGRLRGKPGSPVTITVNRQGFPKPKDFTLERAIINVESVESKLLSNNVGYIKLKGFQGNTARDMRQQITELREAAAKNKSEGGKLKGLVLDMRNNPGGLLDQAIHISDAFLEQGTIVTTVGYSDKLREVKKAQPDNTESQLPLVVIVNSGSASASEIVSGALKNHDRAVVIGRQTFGKGSVQVLYDFPDESALKLTIAQYLTPGDISIQEVGITPDIQLVPSRVSKERIDVFAPKKLIGEADLDKHFGNPESDKVATKREEVVTREKPLEELRYLRELTAAEKREEKAAADDLAALEELEEADPDEFVEDFQIRFAKEMLLAAPHNSRKKMLDGARAFIEQQRRNEEEKIQKGIEALGIDWSAAEKNKAAGKLVATMTAPPRAQAGETLAWTVTVENTGAAPLKRLRAWSESENPWLDRREFVFGAVKPGEKKSWTVNVKLPKDMMSRRDPVKIKFFDDTGATLEDLQGDINIAELPRPAFAYGWQIVDKCEKCNGDGQIQLGETVELTIDVKNIGAGKAWDAVALLKNKADEHIFINRGRAKLGEIGAGQSRGGTFEFELKPEYSGKQFELQLTLGDEPTEEFISEKLSIPVSGAGPTPEKSPVQAIRLSEEAPVYAAAVSGAAKLGDLKKGAVVPAEARVGEFFRVKLPSGWGFVPAARAKETRPDPKAVAALDASDLLRSMPRIQLGIDLQKGGILTDSERFQLQGVASDKDALRDLYIFVNEQKVFFKSASDENPHEIRFNADFPLKEGNNTVLVVAREGKELLSRRVFTIHRNVKGELAQKARPAR